MYYEEVNTIAINPERIGDNLLFLPVLYSLSKTAGKIYHTVRGISAEVLKNFIPKNVELINEERKDMYSVNIYYLGQCWSGKVARNYWSKQQEALFCFWETNREIINQSKLVELYYKIPMQNLLRENLPKFNYTPKRIITICPDTYIRYNRIPVEVIKEVCKAYEKVYNVNIVYSDKNKHLYSSLPGNHLINLTAEELINTLLNSKVYFGSMTGISHLANILGVRSLIYCLKTSDIPFFKPLFTHNLTFKIKYLPMEAEIVHDIDKILLED